MDQEQNNNDLDLFKTLNKKKKDRIKKPSNSQEDAK